MNVHEAVKSFITSKNYRGAIDEKGSCAEQIYNRLNKAVNIFEQQGIANPTEEDFENILKPAIAAKGKKKGEPAADSTINRTLNFVREFYDWFQSKGENEMNEDKIRTTEEEQEEQTGFSLDKGMFDREAPRRERGKPVTNGRSEKISLYLTPQTLNRLDDLRKYDEVNVQDLLNEAIEFYFDSREDDLRFLQEQEEARRARKAKRAVN